MVQDDLCNDALRCQFLYTIHTKHAKHSSLLCHKYPLIKTTLFVLIQGWRRDALNFLDLLGESTFDKAKWPWHTAAEGIGWSGLCPQRGAGWSRWYIRQRCLGKAWLVHRGNCKKSMAMALNKKCGFTSPWCTCFLEKLSKWTVVAYPLCQLENIGPKVSWNPGKLDIFCCCRCPSPGIFPNQFPDAYGLSWHGRSKNFLSISSWSQAKVVNQLT